MSPKRSAAGPNGMAGEYGPSGMKRVRRNGVRSGRPGAANETRAGYCGTSVGTGLSTGV